LSAPDWNASIAFRYRKRSSGHGALEPVRHVGSMSLDAFAELLRGDIARRGRSSVEN